MRKSRRRRRILWCPIIPAES